MRPRFLTVAALAVLFPTVGPADTLVVPEDHRTLSEACAVASAGDEIVLGPGTYRPGPHEHFPIRITREITIRGAGALRTVLDAGAGSAHFRVETGARLELTGLTLARGSSGDGGGAVGVDGAELAMSRVRLTGNVGAGADAIDVREGIARFENCLFDGNGGAGPTVAVRDGTVRFQRCTFAANAGVTLEALGSSELELTRSVLANPGTGAAPSIGVRVAARSVVNARENLFDGCFDGVLVDTGRRNRVLSHRIGPRGLQQAPVRFADPLAIDYRLVTPMAGDEREHPGAYGGSRPLDGGPAGSRARVDDRPAGLLSVPDPESSRTAIRFSVAAPTVVDLGIYNVLGQRVRTLLSRHVPAGEHVETWDGRDDSGEELPPGMYFVRATQGTVTESQRVVLVR